MGGCPREQWADFRPHAHPAHLYFIPGVGIRANCHARRRSVSTVLSMKSYTFTKKQHATYLLWLTV